MCCLRRERVLANQQRIIDILATLGESRRDEPPRDSDQLIAEKEAATLLGISRLTLLRQRKDGKISFVRIGSRVLYRRTDLDHFVERRAAFLRNSCVSEKASIPRSSQIRGEPDPPGRSDREHRAITARS
jgi:excisionase family DNA binding protein